MSIDRVFMHGDVKEGKVLAPDEDSDNNQKKSPILRLHVSVLL